VRVVIDVGANEGQYATRLRRAGFDGRIVSYEPGHGAFARLKANARDDPAWECHQLALGDRDGTVTLNVAADSEGSSLLQVLDREVLNSPGSAFVDSEDVRLARIDSVLSGLSLGDRPIYLKLDTQGSELAILSGAPEALERSELVEAELSLVPLYRGGPLFDEVIDFLDERGFGLISLEGVDEEPDTGHMLQVDAIFLRRNRRARQPRQGKRSRQ
jgi:FkbM family methyltransferase